MSVKTFFTDMWAKIKADIVNAMALIGTVFGSVLSHIDALAAALGDPNLNQQVTTTLADAKAVGRWMLMVSVVTVIAKFKQLVQTPPPPKA